MIMMVLYNNGVGGDSSYNSQQRRKGEEAIDEADHGSMMTPAADTDAAVPNIGPGIPAFNETLKYATLKYPMYHWQ